MHPSREREKKCFVEENNRRSHFNSISIQSDQVVSSVRSIWIQVKVVSTQRFSSTGGPRYLWTFYLRI